MTKPESKLLVLNIDNISNLCSEVYARKKPMSVCDYKVFEDLIFHGAVESILLGHGIIIKNRLDWIPLTDPFEHKVYSVVCGELRDEILSFMFNQRFLEVAYLKVMVTDTKLYISICEDLKK